MLDSLRRGSKTWVAKGLLGLLVISFAVWGIADFVAGNYGGPVAEVGETPVNQIEFSRAYRQATYEFSRRTNRSLTTQEAAQLGLTARVLGGLVSEATFGEMARIENLGASDGEVARLIRSEEAFQGSNGVFDRNLFRLVVQQNGMSENEYINLRRRAALQSQITAGLFDDIEPPKTLLEAYEKIENEERTINYIQINEGMIDPIADPDDAQLTTYFGDNERSYRAPEYRKVELFRANASEIVSPDQVTTEELRNEYDRLKDARFTEPEKRRVLRLAFQNRADADKAASELASGKSFSEVAALFDRSEADIDLGNVTASDIVDEKIRSEAFALTQGAISGIIEGTFSNAIVQVTEISEETVRPMSEVEEALRAEIARSKGRKTILQMFDDVEDARAEGLDFKAITDRFKLKLETVEATDSSGRDVNEETIAVLSDTGELIQSIFDSEVGDEADPVRVGGNDYIWFNVQKITPTRSRTLDEVRSRVIEDWKTRELNTQLSARADALLQSADEGKSLQDIATELGTTVLNAPNVRRAGTEGLSGAVVTAAFGGPVGHRAVARTSDTQRVLIEVADQVIPTFFEQSQTVQQNTTRLRQNMEVTLLEEFVSSLQSEYGVTTNQAALGAVLNPTQHQGGGM